MKDQVITYRGASITLSELNEQDEKMHHLHPANETVLYRGVTGPANFDRHEKHSRKVTYRGAATEMEV